MGGKKLAFRMSLSNLKVTVIVTLAQDQIA